MLSMMFGDPAVWSSLLGILVMGAYFTYMFIHNSSPDEHKLTQSYFLCSSLCFISTSRALLPPHSKVAW
jgi:hypothetical protein